MIQDFIKDLMDAGVPRKEAVRQAREELKRRQECIAESNRQMNRHKRTRAQELREQRGW